MPDVISPQRYRFEFTPYVGILRRRTFLGMRLSINIGYEHRTLEHGVSHPPIVMILERLSLPETKLDLPALVMSARQHAEKAVQDHPRDSIVEVRLNSRECIAWDQPPGWWANRG